MLLPYLRIGGNGVERFEVGSGERPQAQQFALESRLQLQVHCSFGGIHVGHSGLGKKGTAIRRELYSLAIVVT
jgi:hypothetical protein